MARGSDQAQAGATAAQNISNTSAGNAAGLYGTLAPELMAEAANPQGFNPATMAQMQTGAQQSAGGSNAGAAGQGALLAARTRNAGGADAAIAKSSRTAGETLSKGVLGTHIKNAEVKEGQRQHGLSGMEGLFGTSTGASVNSLGEVASNVNANTNAENASWDWAKYIMDPAMQMVGNAGGQALNGYLSQGRGH